MKCLGMIFGLIIDRRKSGPAASQCPPIAGRLRQSDRSTPGPHIFFSKRTDPPTTGGRESRDDPCPLAARIHPTPRSRAHSKDVDQKVDGCPELSKESFKDMGHHGLETVSEFGVYPLSL